MLTLSRRVGERIRIGNLVWGKVVRVHKGHVVLSIDAPKEIPVDREEVDTKRKGQKK